MQQLAIVLLYFRCASHAWRLRTRSPDVHKSKPLLDAATSQSSKGLLDKFNPPGAIAILFAAPTEIVAFHSSGSVVRVKGSPKHTARAGFVCRLSVTSMLAEGKGDNPQFRFGLITDIQYCDCDDAANFAGTEVRRYRDALAQAQEAVQVWNAQKVAFVAQLGDLVDGQNAGQYGAGLSFKEPQSDVALNRVVNTLSACQSPMYHAVGNHELYNFNWDGLALRLRRPNWKVVGDDSEERSISAEDYCFTWRVDGWTFIMVNAYWESVEQSSELPGYEAALALMAKHNPNVYQSLIKGERPSDYFAGIEEDGSLRYVPFNGGIGACQRDWLRKQLRSAVERHDRIVVMSHLPLLPEASSPRTVLYDSDDVLRILHEDGAGQVVACLAGHNHKGGYAVDAMGIHHVTLQSPLIFPSCYATVDVYNDRLELVGAHGGGIPSRTLRF